MAAETYPPIPEDFKLYFFTLGDVNGDGIIDMKDIGLISKARATQDLKYDINGDGKVDMRDVGFASKNFGKTIQAEWEKTVDLERAEEAAAAAGGVAVVPWYIEWARELAKLQAANDQAYANWQNPVMQSFMDNLKGLATLPDDFWKGNIDNADDMLDAQIKADTRVYLDTASLALGTTTKQDFDDELGVSTALGQKLAKDLGVPMGLLPVERFKENKDAADQLAVIQKSIVDAKIASSVLDSVATIASKGRLGGLGDMISAIGGSYGWDTVGALATTIPLNAGVIQAATQYWNSQFFPYIPGVGDLVRMYANKKITDADFAETMAMNGYDEYWQAKYWEAHWTKPTVGDALTAWRRGKIEDAQLADWFELADLDPGYADVWEQRKYNDLSLGMAHELWDIGVVDDAKLFEVAKRAGFILDDINAVVEGVRKFPVRRMKLRVLLTLANGAATGTLDHMRIVAGVAKLGYDQKLVEWIEMFGALRQEMAKSKVAVVRPKLLDLADLKKAYTRGLISQDVLNTELLGRGYQLADIQILVELLNEDKGEVEAGGKVKGLSVTELLSAWRYAVITEDVLRTTLLTRGLPLDEVNVLIETKKKQWNITPTPAG